MGGIGEVGHKVVRYGDNEVCRNHVTKAPKVSSLLYECSVNGFSNINKIGNGF